MRSKETNLRMRCDGLERSQNIEISQMLNSGTIGMPLYLQYLRDYNLYGELFIKSKSLKIAF